MKKTLAMVLALVMMFTLLTGCGGGGGDSGGDGTGAEYTWRMALNGSAPGELGYDMATFFKEKVEELTSGRVSIEFYGGNSLGSTTEVLEGMAAGVADITCESVGTLAPFTNLANIDIMPYIYNGYDHFQAVWGGELGQEILDTVGNDSRLQADGRGYRGARIVTATKEMKTVEDFAGFKLRSPNLEGYIKVWEWMAPPRLPWLWARPTRLCSRAPWMGRRTPSWTPRAIPSRGLPLLDSDQPCIQRQHHYHG